MIDFENNPAATPVLDIHRYVEDFAASVVPAYRRGVADEELGADVGVARSLIPPGTSATRDFSALAPRIPDFLREKCVGCMLCISACPEAALLDSPEAPMLRFIERNCVQCGLCVNTCPEDALKVIPRLVIGAKAKEAVTLNEAEPFNCVRCGKPFGTRQMVDNMLGKLSGHSMFAGGVRRLQMCGDCRVVDMMENKGEASIFDFTKR